MDESIVGLIKLSFFMFILSFVFMLLLREFWCWYWKINKKIKLLIEIRNLLLEQQQSIPDKPITTLNENRWAPPK